jgi:hypothetical protein
MDATDWKTRTALALGLTATLLPSEAAAQDVAAAEALFNKGLAAMNQGRYEEACPKIEESHRLDPRPGGLFTLAECENKRGRIATASARYDEYLRLTATLQPAIRDRQKDRIAIAKSAQAGLARRIPKLRLKVTPTPVPIGVVLERDGRVVGAGSLDEPIPVDPGEHVIVVKQPSGTVREVRLKLKEGEQRTLEVDASLEAPRPSPVAPAGAEAKAPTSEASPASPSPRRTIGWVVGSVGLAGLAAGAVTGGLALGAKGVVDDNCIGTACNAEGFDAVERGRTFGTVSTIAFAVGGAATVAGVVLVLTAPTTTGGVDATSQALTLRATPDGAGAFLGLSGRF